MKVILYMATTINGFIASEDHDTPWTDAEWDSYSSKVKETGNLIIGKITYDFMASDGSYEKLGNPTVVCLTKSVDNSSSNNHYFVKDFSSAIKLLTEQGFNHVLVGGGGFCDTAALESGLIDEIYIDVEPVLFGKGIPLFRISDTNLKLQLIDHKQIGESGIQLHYRVIK